MIRELPAVKPIKILILGATGMLGHKLFLHLSGYKDFQVSATARSPVDSLGVFNKELAGRVISGVDAGQFSSIIAAINAAKPDVIINCIGIIKQGSLGADHLANISLNALLPHRLAEVCQKDGIRLLHISTDCVFSGKKGNYREDDESDASDVYGKTKYLGEVNYPNCLTLRTSIIGHEFQSQLGLIEWFLAQSGKIQGYTSHIYTGFSTIELAKIIARFIVPNTRLHGLYHLSSSPISKYRLLKLVAETYTKDIEIEPYGETFCDRSLDSTKLRGLIHYTPPSWPQMVREMHQDFLATEYLR